jgi:short-subunit dehydrogenase
MSAFAGREVLLTGAAGGIGGALAADLALAGARPWLVDRDAPALEALASRLAPAGAKATVCDLARPEERRGITAAVSSGERRVDVLVLAAGSTVVAPFEEVSEAEYDEVFQVNFGSALDLVRAAYPHMARRGEGAIVAVGSIAGLVSQPLTHPYVAAKHALAGLMKGLQHEARARGVRLTLACPGYVDTRMFHRARVAGVAPERIYAALKAQPLRMVPPAAAARRILRDAARGRFLSVFPLHARAYLWLYQLHAEWALALAGRLVGVYEALRRGGDGP